MRDSYGSYVIEDSSVADRSMNIILDLGMKFSKVGFAGEIEPRKIIRTPNIFDNEKFLNDCAKTKIANFQKSQNEENKEIKEATNIPMENISTMVIIFQ